MAARKKINAKQHYSKGMEMEKSGETEAAIKYYQKATASDKSNTQAWNRLMILYRKSKTKLQEIALIRSAIKQLKEAAKNDHQNWLKTNQQKAESSRELAQVLGLLEEDGQPITDDTTIEKWETRLYLLEYRVKNARIKQKRPTKAKPSQKKNSVKK